MELETVSVVETEEVDRRRTPSWSYSKFPFALSAPFKLSDGDARDAGEEEDVGKLMVEC